jgi:F-type H+-transporting ATPase subunit a
VFFALTLPPSEQPLFKIANLIPVPSLVVTEWAIILIIGVIAYFATRNMQRVPRGLQNSFEYVIQTTVNFFGSMMTESAAKKWAPLLSTFFLFIIVSNYCGMIPGSSTIPGFKAPTSDWNVTATLALIVFFSVHVSGLVEHKLHYFGHFVKPYWPFLPLNLLEELAHPLSLTLRLFGNIFGEEMIISFLTMMAPFLIPMLMMALGVLTGLIQAIVFAILASTYIGAATSEGH